MIRSGSNTLLLSGDVCEFARLVVGVGIESANTETDDTICTIWNDDDERMTIAGAAVAFIQVNSISSDEKRKIKYDILKL